MVQIWPEVIQIFIFSIIFNPLAVFLESMEERGHWRRQYRCFIAMCRCRVTTTRSGDILGVRQVIFSWGAFKPEALKFPKFVITCMIFGYSWRFKRKGPCIEG